jgi:hypothetical protein
LNVEIDLSWLLMVAEQYTPGDPRVTDYGSLVAAVTRHQAEIFDVLVYPEPEDRAAALMHQLIRVPSLERNNELFATTREMRSLARAVRDGRIGVDGASERLAGWIVDQLPDPEDPDDSDDGSGDGRTD